MTSSSTAGNYNSYFDSSWDIPISNVKNSSFRKAIPTGQYVEIMFKCLINHIGTDPPPVDFSWWLILLLPYWREYFQSIFQECNPPQFVLKVCSCIWLFYIIVYLRRQDNTNITRRNPQQEYQIISQARDIKLAAKKLFWSAIKKFNAHKFEIPVLQRKRILQWTLTCPRIRHNREAYLFNVIRKSGTRKGKTTVIC